MIPPAVADITTIPKESINANSFDSTELTVHSQVAQYEPYDELKFFITTLLNYGNKAKLRQLTVCRWIEDSLKAKNTIPVGPEAVAAIAEWKALIEVSREMICVNFSQFPWQK